jgi:RimJ/RimL family protein N-acetyltransferase
MMSPTEFATYHIQALAKHDAKHCLILAILARLRDPAPASGLLYWSFGRPGACAVKSGPYPIVLGDLDQAECGALADATVPVDYPGVVGPDLTAQWFVARAETLGLRFLDPVRQRISTLREPPRYPNAPGHARPATAEDAALVADWTLAFLREAVPHDPIPPRSELERQAGEGRHFFWIADGRPVSMAAIARRLPKTGAINSVYTPPELRGRGYAGSVTAAVVERIFAEGRRTACLYTDLSNPASNRCYAKIGFRALCGSLHYSRRPAGEE